MVNAPQIACRIGRGRRATPRRARTARSRARYHPQLESLEPRIALSFNPTGLEQELFQLVNRFRTDPQGELTRLVNRLNPVSSLDRYVNQQLQYWGVNGTTLAAQWKQLVAVPPLAWSEPLYNAAHAHNLAMLAHDEQQHQFDDEPSPGQRMTAAGYDWQRYGENIYAYPRSVFEAHAGFVIDWGEGPAGIQDPPNHRIQLLREEYVHIGVAIDDVGYDATRNVGPLIVTQDLAAPRAASSAYVVGAVYKAKGGSPWYTAGSGYGNVHVVFTGAAGTFETTSMSAGGYQIQLPPGTYRGWASGGGLPAPLVSDLFTVGSANVAIDLVYPTHQARRPVAADDAAVTRISAACTVQVLANDRSLDGSLDPSTLTILTGPAFGTVTVDNATGEVTYLPEPGFSGLDRFEYQVHDDDALASNVATVRVLVRDPQDTPWQNPINPLDVNLDECVTPLDALQIINAINAGAAVLPVPPQAGMRPPPLLDVTGDNIVSPYDALLVINYLNLHEPSDGEGEGESPVAAPAGDRAWNGETGCPAPEPSRLPIPHGVPSGPPSLPPAASWALLVGFDPRAVESTRRASRERRRPAATDDPALEMIWQDWPVDPAQWRFSW